MMQQQYKDVYDRQVQETLMVSSKNYLLVNWLYFPDAIIELHKQFQPTVR